LLDKRVWTNYLLLIHGVLGVKERTIEMVREKRYFSRQEEEKLRRACNYYHQS